MPLYITMILVAFVLYNFFIQYFYRPTIGYKLAE